MTALGDDAVMSMAARIVAHLQKQPIYGQLEKAAQNEVTKSSIRVSDLKRGIITELAKSGWERKLRNSVYQCMLMFPRMPHPLSPQEHSKEPVAYIRKAQITWEKRIFKSLNSMCTELGVPLARKRPEKEQKELASKWTELGTDEPDWTVYKEKKADDDREQQTTDQSADQKSAKDPPTDTPKDDLSQFRPVYAPKDFLEVIAALKNPNLTEGLDNINMANIWGMVQISLPVKDIHALRVQFSEISINQCQTGVDDGAEVPPELFQLDRKRLAKKVLTNGHSPLAQEFAKKGCPVSSRAKLWCTAMNINVDEIDVLYYEQLKSNVIQHDLLVDNLIYKDVKLTTTNDDQYFVFEDYVYQILLPFSRDTKVIEVFEQCGASPAKSYIRGKLGMEEFAVNYPPNGIIPFHGFSMYVSPLCYMYDEPITLYYVFRELYMRFFSKLHILSSHPQGIVSLCLLFETLLQTREPQLYYHLKSSTIQPLKIAFKWLIRGFSGYLSSEQVLLLWDRIIAYNSLEILPVLAMSIFSFRKTNLMQVQTYSAAEGVMADISTLKVIPLIQLSLFSQ